MKLEAQQLREALRIAFISNTSFSVTDALGNNCLLAEVLGLMGRISCCSRFGISHRVFTNHDVALCS